MEADETVIFSIASGTGYAQGSPSSATATIVNDDFPVASIAAAPASVAEDGPANLIDIVTLDQTSPSAVSVAFGVAGWGRLTPQLRVEYQRDFQGRGDPTLSYADLSGGPFYRTGQAAFDRNRLMVGIGAASLTEQGLSTRLEYRGITGGDSGDDQTWMINLEKKY